MWSNIGSFLLELFKRCINSLKCFLYFVKFILQKLSIWKQGHKHLVQRVIFLQQVLIWEFNFSPLRQLLLSIHQDILTQQLLKNLVFFLKLRNWKVNRHNRSLQTAQKFLLRVCLFSILSNSPKEILITQLIDLFQRKGDLELLVYLNNSVLHLLLLSLMLFQLIFHFFVTILCILNLCFQPSSYLFFLFFNIFQLCIKLIIALLETFQFFIFTATQLLLQILYFASNFFLPRTQHLSPQTKKCPSSVLSFQLFQQSEHVFTYFNKLNNGLCAFESVEVLLHLLIVHLYDLSYATTITGIYLELLPITELLQLFQYKVKAFSFFAHYKCCNQFDGGSSLLFKCLLQMLNFLKLTCQ